MIKLVFIFYKQPPVPIDGIISSKCHFKINTTKEFLTMKRDLRLRKKDRYSIKKSLMSFLVVLFTSFCLVTPAMATGLYELPNSPFVKDIWVVDLANEISLATQGSLSKTFKDLATSTGQEIRMVAIRRLDYGQTIDTLADKLFARWYPSEESQSNQTLLVMDTLTNTAAIRTGESATTLVSPEMAESLLRETISYDLRNGNQYNQAFIDASERLVAVLSGEADPGPTAVEKTIQVASTFSSAEETDDGIAFTWVIVLLVVATVVPMVTYFLYVM